MKHTSTEGPKIPQKELNIVYLNSIVILGQSVNDVHILFLRWIVRGASILIYDI